MTVYEAIKEMRRLSKEGIPFSFSFMSFSHKKQSSKGIVDVRVARLRGKAKDRAKKHSDFIENYLDLDTNEPRRFYLPLLMVFNGEKVELV